MAEQLRGNVKWFNDAKGFGFIEHPSGRDVFVHYSVIESEGFKTLKDGEDVIYELKEGEKGLHAARVIRTTVDESVQSAESDAEEEADAPIAPKLERGTVTSVAKTVDEMVEREAYANREDTDTITAPQPSQLEKNEDIS